MDQLPVSLISTDLKYTLSSLKIKTLQKARQYYLHQQFAIEQGVLDLEESVGVVDKLEKIKKYLSKYDQVRDQVWAKINFRERLDQGLGQGQMEGKQQQGQMEGQQQQQRQQGQIRQNFTNNNSNNNNRILNQSQANDTSRTKSITIDNQNVLQPINNCNNILKQHQPNISSLNQLITNCLSQPAITQITGLKGTGKSALALYFSQIFPTLTNNSNKKLYFLNCSAGMTHPRFIRLQQKCPKLQYRDSYQLQHVLKVCDSALKDQHVGCLVIDGLTNLLMEEQKTLVFLLKLFKIFTNLLINRQCKIVITNYVQQLFEHVNENQQLTNHYTYYSSVTSQFIKYKFYLKKQKNNVKVKLIRGGSGTAEFGIRDDGVMEG